MNRKFSCAVRATLTWIAVAVIGFVFAYAVVGSAEAADAEPFIELSHTSDILRGCPFACDKSEPAADRILGGVTFTVGRSKEIEIDLTHGYQRLNYGPDRMRWQTASEVTVRIYPGRTRRNKR